MKIPKIARQLLAAAFLVALVSVTASSCKSSGYGSKKYGCPNKITQEVVETKVNV